MTHVPPAGPADGLDLAVRASWCLERAAGGLGLGAGACGWQRGPGRAAGGTGAGCWRRVAGTCGMDLVTGAEGVGHGGLDLGSGSLPRLRPGGRRWILWQVAGGMPLPLASESGRGAGATLPLTRMWGWWEDLWYGRGGRWGSLCVGA